MRFFRVLAAFMFALLLVPTGAAVAGAADLHRPHVGTSVTCDGAVLWHFVHNQVPRDSMTAGDLTATFQGAGAVTVTSNKVLSSVRHYDVVTPTSDTLLGASDTIAAGKLVLSHTECVPGVPTTDECATGDVVTITWGDAELGHQWMVPDELVFTASTSATLLPGTYDVALTSTDTYHAAGIQPEQTSEQWFVVLTSGGTEIARTGTIGDLPTELTTITAGVGQVTLSTSTDTAIAHHALWDAGIPWTNPESVEPTSAVFTCV